MDPFYLAFAKYENPMVGWIAKSNLAKEYGAKLGKPRPLTDSLHKIREPLRQIRCEECKIKVHSRDVKDLSLIHI